MSEITPPVAPNPAWPTIQPPLGAPSPKEMGVPGVKQPATGAKERTNFKGSTPSSSEAGRRQGQALSEGHAPKEMKIVDPKRTDYEDDPDFNGFVKSLEVFGPGGKEEPIPGYHLQWVNDESARIQMLQQRGWELVSREEIGLNEKVNPLNKNLGDYVSQVVGVGRSGAPLTAYLMKVKNERWEQFQRAVSNKNAEIAHQVRTGTLEAQSDDMRYNPGDNPRSRFPATKV